MKMLVSFEVEVDSNKARVNMEVATEEEITDVEELIGLTAVLSVLKEYLITQTTELAPQLTPQQLHTLKTLI